MGAGPVTARSRQEPAELEAAAAARRARPRASWSAASARCRRAEALFLQFDWPENRRRRRIAALGCEALARSRRITDATGDRTRAAALAFTWTGPAETGSAGRGAGELFARRFAKACTRKTGCAGSATRSTANGKAPSSTAARSGAATRRCRTIAARRAPRRRCSRQRAGDHAADGARAAAALRQGRDAVDAWAEEVAAALAPHGVEGRPPARRSTCSSTTTASRASISASPTACRSRFPSATQVAAG